MELQTAKNLVERLGEHGIEAYVYEGYSGRGMFGQETSGLVLSDRFDLKRAMAVCACRALEISRKDDLGRGVILY